MGPFSEFIVFHKPCGMGTPTAINVNTSLNPAIVSIVCGRCGFVQQAPLIPAPMPMPMPNPTVKGQTPPTEEKKQEKPSPMAKLMQEIIEKKDMKKLEKNKEKLNAQEYEYCREIILRAEKAN